MLTKTTTVDQITVTENGTILYRETLRTPEVIAAYQAQLASNTLDRGQA